MKPVRTWILVANSEQAKILLNDGVGHGLKHLEGCDFLAEHKTASDIMADKPGRTFDSHGPGRHSMEYSSDPEREQKKKFLTEIAEFLDRHLLQNDYDRLIIVAPPKTLGDLRTLLSDAVTLKIHGELNKNLTDLKAESLAKHLEGIIAL